MDTSLGRAQSKAVCPSGLLSYLVGVCFGVISWLDVVCSWRSFLVVAMLSLCLISSFLFLFEEHKGSEVVKALRDWFKVLDANLGLCYG